VSGLPYPRSLPLFNKAKGSAPFHSIESKDDLISAEDGDEPVHCTRGVMWAWCGVFSEDAHCILHISHYRVLIRIVHNTRLTERGLNARCGKFVPTHYPAGNETDSSHGG
jgi:hypothetical protein